MTRVHAHTILLAILLVSVVACSPSAPPAPERSIDDLLIDAYKLDLAGKPDEAAAIYRQALARQADSYDAHYGLGRVLDLSGRYEDARAHFTRAVDLAPASHTEQAMRMLAISWTFVRDLDHATGLFRDVYDRRLAANNLAAAAESANELARVYLELGDIDSAQQWYRTGHDVARRDKDLVPVLADLAEIRWEHAEARIAARRGDATAASRHAAAVKRLIDKGGNADQQVQYTYLLGYMRFYLADYGGAREQLRQADQTDPFILLLLAQASEKLQEPAEARAYYEKVLASTSHAINAAFARPIARARLEAGVR
jgi:tetratricopeptide (TPR) repeat protein